MKVKAIQVLGVDRWLFMVDEEGNLWNANVFAAVENYGQTLEWHKVKLPEMDEGRRYSSELE